MRSRRVGSTLFSVPNTNLDLGALDLGVEPVVRGEGDRQEGSGDYTGYGGKGQRHRGARHLDILSPISFLAFSFSLSLSSSWSALGLSSSPVSSVSFTSHSPRLVVIAINYVGISTHKKKDDAATKRTTKRRAGPRFGEFWRTRARGSLNPAEVPGDEKKIDGESGEKFRLASVRNIRVLRRPSGCALRHHAHHTTIPFATATILTARLSTYLEGKPAREQGERTGPQVGMDS